MVYRPPETELLRRARRRGARTVNGLEMLVEQGAASFRFWIGREPPIETMRRAVREHLRAAPGNAPGPSLREVP
jgi:shikimate dehydrogenase